MDTKKKGIMTGLCVSIFPAVVIITQNELRWYRVIGGILLCLICVGAPLAAREITLRSDKKHETHGPAGSHPEPVPELARKAAGELDHGGTPLRANWTPSRAHLIHSALLNCPWNDGRAELSRKPETMRMSRKFKKSASPCRGLATQPNSAPVTS